MKYLIVLGLSVAAFIGGIYYENYRLAGEPDKTIAIMLSKQAIENSIFQLKTNSEYLLFLKRQDYEGLVEKISTNTKLLTEIKKEAQSICNAVKCSKEQQAFIAGANYNVN